MARYTDASGVHEMDLDDVQVTPFMVVKNGKHNVYMSKTENE